MSSLIVEVCEISDIQVHPNADRLEIARVKGWDVIIQKDQYAVGSLVVFIPPDCVLPDSLIEKYELTYLKKNGRTGTVKLRGIISQGLVLPAKDFYGVILGKNVAEDLGITKYEVPEPAYSNLGGKQVSRKKLNPLFDKYTDIENIKNYNTVFQEGELVVVTEKLHGCNARYGNIEIQVSDSQPFLYKLSSWFRKSILGQKYEFVWGSHNVQKGALGNKDHFYGEDVWGEIAQRYDLANLLPQDYIFYGEIVGKNIQDLNYGFTKQTELFIFDIKNTKTGEYLDWDLVQEWCQYLQLNIVPILGIGEYNEGILKEYTTGNTLVGGNHIREGVVVRPIEEKYDNRLGRKILKSISPDYLTRKDGTEFK